MGSEGGLGASSLGLSILGSCGALGASSLGASALGCPGMELEGAANNVYIVMYLEYKGCQRQNCSHAYSMLDDDWQA